MSRVKFGTGTNEITSKQARSPFGINRRNAAPTPTGLAEIVGYDFSILHAHDVRQFIENVSRRTSTLSISKSGELPRLRAVSPESVRDDYDTAKIASRLEVIEKL